MSKKPEFADLFFSKTKDFLDIFLKSQEQRSRDTIKAYRISLSSFYKYVTEVKEMIVMQFCFSDCAYVLSGKLNDVPSGRLFRADLGFLQMCQSL